MPPSDFTTMGGASEESLIAAQAEAEEITRTLEEAEAKQQAKGTPGDVTPPPLQAPKLLESQDLDIGNSNKNHQLQYLLQKAEQYSGFIAAHQEEALKAHARTLEEQEEEGDDGEEEEEGVSRTRGGKRRLSHSKGSGGAQKTKKPRKAKSKEASKAGNEKDSAVSLSEAASKMEKAKGAQKDQPVFRQPDLLTGGKLKQYQLEGLRWLITLYENGLSGILADEMGLGKTIQVIALLAHLRQSKVNGPFIVAAPLATLPNWVNEFKKWTPTIPVVLYHGSKEERARLRKEVMPPTRQGKLDFPVVITSYEICVIDRPALQHYNWKYLIIDEGQRIKNMNCRLVRELKQLNSESRLLLSGTPIQNTLEELWSLLNFVNPVIFDDLTVFQSWFGFRNIGKETSVDDIVSNEEKDRIVSKLHEILRPFLLRRLKKDVLSREEIPPKREIVVYAGMTTVQRWYYQHVLEGTLRDALMKMGLEGASKTSQINMNMNQRKVCQHPFLFGEPRDPATGEYVGTVHPEVLIGSSGKLQLLDRMLLKLHKGGHKVLIFSQMVEMLHILEDYLLYRKWGFCRIDGSVDVIDRQERIDRFNKDDSLFVFLLSTRAGGLGINLTAADTVIIFDSDWNPHQDTQAQDRCHRIGQSRPVIVYRLLTVGTVEIEMMEKQISKKKLERMAVQGGDFAQAGRRMKGELTTATLRQLLMDDVKNLGQRGVEGEDTKHTFSISEKELDLILDRNKVFAQEANNWARDDAAAAASSSSSGGGGGSSHDDKGADGERKGEEAKELTLIPDEGECYDVLATPSDTFLKDLS